MTGIEKARAKYREEQHNNSSIKNASGKSDSVEGESGIEKARSRYRYEKSKPWSTPVYAASQNPNFGRKVAPNTGSTNTAQYKSYIDSYKSVRDMVDSETFNNYVSSDISNKLKSGEVDETTAASIYKHYGISKEKPTTKDNTINQAQYDSFIESYKEIERLSNPDGFQREVKNKIHEQLNSGEMNNVTAAVLLDYYGETSNVSKKPIEKMSEDEKLSLAELNKRIFKAEKNGDEETAATFKMLKQKSVSNGVAYSLLDTETKRLVSEVCAGQEADRDFNISTFINGVLPSAPSDTGYDRELSDSRQRAVEATDKASQARGKLLAMGYTEEDIDALAKSRQKNLNSVEAALSDSKTREFASEHPIASSVGSVISAPAGAILSAADMGYSAIKGDEIDTNSKWQSIQQQGDTIRSTVQENHDLKIGNYDVFDEMYSTVMSTADSMLAATMPGVTGGAVIGLQAGTSAVRSMKDKGASDKQALLTGAVAFAAETLFESISIGKFKALQATPAFTWRAVAKNVAKEAAVNASEEAATEAANIIYDTLANGRYSDYEAMYRQYKAQGVSDAEIKRNITADFAKQVGKAAAGGAFQGIMLGGASSVGSRIGNAVNEGYVNRMVGEETINSGDTAAVLAQGAAAPKGSASAKLSSKINNKFEKKGEVSAAKLGQLVRKNNRIMEGEGRFADVKTTDELDLAYDTAKEQLGRANLNPRQSKSVQREINRDYKANKKTVRITEAMNTAYEQAKTAKENRTTDERTTLEQIHPELSVDGKTVTLDKIKGVEDGKIEVETTHGDTVEIEASNITDDRTRTLFEAGSDLKAHGIETFVKHYDGGSVDAYRKAFDYFYKMGRAGATLDTIRHNDSGWGEYLTAEAQREISNAGAADREFKAGFTDFSIMSKSRQYKYESRILDAMAKEFNTEIIMCDDLNSINSQYIKGTNRILLSRSSEGKLVLRSAGHEAYHMVEEWSREHAEKLSSFVVDALKSKGVDVEKSLKKYAAQGYDTKESQMSELVADSMFEAFYNEKFVKEIAADQKLAQKLSSALHKIINAINNAIQRLGLGNKAEIKALSEDRDALDNISKMLAEGMRAAGEKVKGTEKEKSDTDNSNAINSTKDYDKPITNEDIAALRKWKNTQKPKVITNKYKGDIDYIVWEGTRKHPKAVKNNLENVNIEERGSFYVVTDDNGKEILRKKIGSNGTYVRKTSNETVFSTKDAPAINTYYGEVIRENNTFKQIWELMGETFSSARKDIHLNSRDISKIAIKLLKDKSSKYDKDKLISELTTVYDYMAQAKSNRTYDADALYEAIQQVAMHIVNESTMKDTEEWDNNADIRNYLKNAEIYITPKVKKEIDYAYGGFSNFRKALFGKINRISTTNNKYKSLDEMWGELCEIAPGWFSPDTNELDMPTAITKFFEVIAPKIVNPYEEYSDGVEHEASLLAVDIFNEYYNVGVLKSDRDKYRDLVYRNLEKTKKLKSELRKQYNKELKKLKEQSLEDYKKALRKQSEKREETERRRILRNDIGRNARYLARRLNHERDTDHIPEGLKDVSRALVEALQQDETLFTVSDLKNFSFEYSKLKGKTDLYDEGINNYIDAFIESAGTDYQFFGVANLSTAEIIALRDITEHIKYIVKKTNEMFNENIKETVGKLGRRIITEIKRASNIQGQPGKAAQMISNMDKFKTGMTKPEYLFDKIGSETLSMLAKEIRRSENKEGILLRDSQKRLTDIKDQNKYDERWKYQTVTANAIVNDEEKSVTMTIEQAMSIYATAHREQGRNHLIHGGVTFFEAKTKKNKKGDKDNNEAKTFRRVRFRFSAEQLEDFEKVLTSEQISYVNAMVEYITKDVGAMRNETSMTLYGIEKYKEKYYFPIVTDADFIDTVLGKKEVEAKIEHQRSSKRTVEKARNPVMIDDFSTTVASHVYDSILYCTRAVPLKDFNRVFNYRDGNESVLSSDDVETVTEARGVAMSIRNAAGINTFNEIKQYIEAVDSGTKSSENMPLIAKGIAKYKKASVMANVSVVVQQPSAIWRAALYLNPKYFANKVSRNTIEEMRKYNGCVTIKDIGYFDVNMGRTVADWLNNYRTSKEVKKDWTGKDRVRVYVAKSGKVIDDAGGWGASKADEITWGILWNACKKQIAADTGLTGEELMVESSKLFGDVVAKTQVYDSVHSKCKYMRDRNNVASQILMFMSEPITSLNMLGNSVANASRAEGAQKKSAQKMVARAFAAYVASLVVNGVCKSFVQAFRDDDPDKTFLEKYIAAVVENIIYEPIEMIPIVKDIFNLLRGYDLNRADMATFIELKRSIDKMSSDNATNVDIIMSLIKVAGYASGLPANSVARDAVAIKNIVQMTKDMLNHRLMPTTREGVKQAIKGKFDWLPGVKVDTKYRQLYEAMVRGDIKHYDRVYDAMINEGKDDDTITKGIEAAIKDAYKEEEISEREATELLMQFNDEKTSESDIYWQLRRIDDKKGKTDSDDEDESWSKYSNLYKAIESGAGAKEAIDELKNHGVTNKAIVSAISSRYGEEYAELYASDKGEAASLKKSISSTLSSLEQSENDIYWKFKSWESGNEEYSKYDALKSAVENGVNINKAVSELTSHSDGKDANKSVASQITKMFKPKYIKLYETNPAEAARLKENLIEAYAVIGYDRAEAIDEWIED